MMINKLLGTNDEITSFILRIMLGVVFLPHGAQKIFGWFGGYGFSGTMDFFTKAGIPAFLAFLAIMAESVGSVALIAGFFTRIAALGIAVNMVVCAIGNHIQNGFFMNWFGQQKGEGFEFHILVIALAIGLMIKGGGKWSVDAAIAKY
jgi:putative oxidoreductase